MNNVVSEEEECVHVCVCMYVLALRSILKKYLEKSSKVHASCIYELRRKFTIG